MNSLWIEKTKNDLNLNPLERDEKTEVCVIGAGLFGLTTAYYLTMLGKKSYSIRERKNRRKS